MSTENLFDDILAGIIAEAKAKPAIFAKWEKPKAVARRAEGGQKSYFFHFSMYAKGKTDVNTIALAERMSEVLRRQRVNYFVFEVEHGLLGTPHIQGFIVLQDRKRRHELAKLLKYLAWAGHCGAVWCDIARHAPQNNFAYCVKEYMKKKDTKWYEYVNENYYFY